MGDLPQHTGELRALLVLRGAADLAEAECAERAIVLPRLADAAAHLGDLDGAHAVTSAASAAGSSATSAAGASTLRYGSTSEIVLPRSRATSSGRRSALRPATVALAMLIGFVVPRLFATPSRIPASSSTARTPPPAITPVPSEAGRRNTLAASKRPRISCVIVVPCFGTVKRFFFASSTAFEMASGTSRAL